LGNLIIRNFPEMFYIKSPFPIEDDATVRLPLLPAASPACWLTWVSAHAVFKL
jgi:hypothetical protein